MAKPVILKWFPHNDPWIKINTGSSLVILENAAACGGVLRDHEGRFLAGFSAKLGDYSIHQAESWPIFHGSSLLS